MFIVYTQFCEYTHTHTHTHTDSGVTEPGQHNCFKKLYYYYYIFSFAIPTLILSSQFMISVCTPLLSIFHQCNITEIKPQAKVSPQFGLFNSKKPSASGGTAPQTPCFTPLNFLALPSLNTQLRHCRQTHRGFPYYWPTLHSEGTRLKSDWSVLRFSGLIQIYCNHIGKENFIY